MTNQIIPPDLAAEFEDFKQSPPVEPPITLSSNVLTKVSVLMNPSPYTVFAKLSIVVFFVGLLNTTLCPQFGLSFVRNSGLMEYFMSFGRYGCDIACGAFFLGTGLLTSSFLLKPEDVIVIKAHIILQVSALSALSLVFFVASGGDIYFEKALLWFIGSVLGGLVSLELGYFFKMTLLKRSFAQNTLN